MSKVSRDTSKPKYYAGSVPGGSDFANLIDSALDICASTQPAIHSTASLQAGTGISLTQTGSVIKITSTAETGVSLAASEQPALVNNASLQVSASLSLTQTGSVIALARTGGSGMRLAEEHTSELFVTASLQAGSPIILTQAGSIIKIDKNTFKFAASGQEELDAAACLQ